MLILKIPPVMVSFVANLAQSRIMWKERASIKEFYRSDWPVTMSMRVCFD